MAIAIPAPRVRVLGVEAFEQPFRLRMPFRFGVITLTEGIQAIVRVQVRLGDGREGFGYAAEMLAAKWFDKNPVLSRRAEPAPAAQGDRARHHRLPGGAAVDAVRAVRRPLPLPDPRRPRARPAAAGLELRQRPARPRGDGRRLPDRRRQLLDGDAQQPRRHGAASADSRPRRLRLHRLPRRPRAGAQHRRAAHGRAGRPDRRRRPGDRHRGSATACPRRSRKSSPPTASAASSSRSAATARPTSSGW